MQEYLFIRCKIWNRIKNYLNKLSIYIYIIVSYLLLFKLYIIFN